MSDLISRKAFVEHWNKEYRYQYANDTFLFALANFPAVDAVEVVKCKECKHMKLNDESCEQCDDIHEECGVCMYSGNCVRFDGYCSYGERRSE